MSYSEILVTLIIPCYGVEKYLNRCVNSALKQTHSNIEILLVDDGALDRSGEIADELARRDSRIKVIHKENGGVSSARNAGIDLAKGEYICFADGDDWLEADYVEYLLKLAIDTGSDIALSDRVYVSTRDSSGSVDFDRGYKVVNSDECTKLQLYYKIRTVAVFNKIYRAGLLSTGGMRFNPDFFMGEGFNFNIRAYQQSAKIAIGHKRVYWYFKENSASATSKFSMEHIENGLASIEDMQHVIGGRDKSVINAWKYAKYHTICDFYAGMIRHDKKVDFPARYNQFSRYIRLHIIDALRAPVSLKEKIRPLIFAIVPGAMIYMMISNRYLRKIYLKKRSV